MNILIKIVLVALATLWAASAQAGPDQTAQDIFKALLSATISNDYDGFVAVCDAPMKAALTKTTLESVSKQIEPRAKGGYDSEFLGELNQRGYAVHLWRLRFKDGKDDVLATLSLRDGKAGGFLLR